MKRIPRLLGDQGGVTAIEYALIAALIAIAIVGGVALVGVELHSMYERICSAVSEALGGGAC
ncbi:MAG: Flp family type IVb pilin [Burkholderiaceae bacterium]|nr:Flp family type IVb pilin [Burkholderiaceae bacterium]